MATDERKVNVIVSVCREDSRADVDETYGPGTYDRLFPQTECPHCGIVYFAEHLHMCKDTQDVEQ